MRLVFTPSAWEGYLWFQERNKPLLKRVNPPIRDILRTPFDGSGKPELSKGELAGYWSRRTHQCRASFGVCSDSHGGGDRRGSLSLPPVIVLYIPLRSPA